MYSPTQLGFDGPQPSSSSPTHPFTPTPSSSSRHPAFHPGRAMPFADPHAQHHPWFATSLDSPAPPPFGPQSPNAFPARDLIVSPSTSASHIDGSGGFTGGEEDEAQQRNLQEMFEKRRRRRESHNAVERRRRDNINDRIQELSTLLPDHLVDTVPPSANVMTVSPQHYPGSPNGNSAARAINKGTILKLSVDHIKELQSEVSRYKDRINQLEHVIDSMKQQHRSQQLDSIP